MAQKRRSPEIVGELFCHPKSGQLVPVQRPTDGAECVRACFAGAAANGAKAPTQRAARRNRRRMWCLGLRLDAQGGGGGGGGDSSATFHSARASLRVTLSTTAPSNFF